MNILFTTSAAPKKSPFSTTEKRPPLGLGFLISLTRNEGHKVFFIDNYLSPSNFIEDGFLQDNNIDFVGISSNTICFKDTLRMINEIENLRKKGLWSGKMIVGGPHTSVAPQTIPDFVDYIIQGEGESAILEIINNKEKKRIVRGKRINSLDSLPFQPWDIFTKLFYDYTCPRINVSPVFTMNTSRGCPFNCSFCSVGSIWGKEYTYFSADRIISEIEYLIENYNAKGIYFREDHFTLNMERTKLFCRKLIEKKINIHWACETRVDCMSEELVKLMSLSGCKSVYLGVESGSQRILDKLNKKITISQIENTINWCKKYKIKAYCSLIIGTPGEKYEDYLLTKQLMKKLKPYSYRFNIFVGIPNSPLYKHILKNNLYEYIDNIGLMYLPGYDIKTKYFYNISSKSIVNHNFRKKTYFDKKLLKQFYKNKFTNIIKTIIKFTISTSPGVIINELKQLRKYE